MLDDKTRTEITDILNGQGRSDLVNLLELHLQEDQQQAIALSKANGIVLTCKSAVNSPLPTSEQVRLIIAALSKVT